MGMDVYGKNPTSDKGQYFRNNVWWWHPLWEYCQELHGSICGQVQDGHSNAGDGLDADDAKALGEALLHDIATGVTAEYEQDYNARIASLPMGECSLCDSTGIRTDEIGIQHGMPTRELSESDAILLGRTHGFCNGCAGFGKTAPWAASYPFRVANVQEFADFLVDSGGFSIW